MSEHLVRPRYAGVIGEIELANPPLNLVTQGMLSELHHAIREITRREGLRVVIVHGGEARAFCAGSDMREFNVIRADAAEKKILLENFALRELANLELPTIAAIAGAALGGGLELALACDLRIADPDAKLGLPEARIGGLASNGSQRLARIIGPARAKEMLFLGSTLSADEALRIGLVNRIAPSGSVLTAARELAGEIAQRGPLSIKLAKKLVDAASGPNGDSEAWKGIEAQQAIFDSADLVEGSDAFFAHRTPTFKGR